MQLGTKTLDPWRTECKPDFFEERGITGARVVNQTEFSGGGVSVSLAAVWVADDVVMVGSLNIVDGLGEVPMKHREQDQHYRLL